MEELVAATLAGEDVVFTRYGKPVARMRQLTPEERTAAAEKLAES
jgi:antitoxin (DNA-binding transcriptional repressor) of toxin-antitoxin stability system